MQIRMAATALLSLPALVAAGCEGSDDGYGSRDSYYGDSTQSEGSEVASGGDGSTDGSWQAADGDAGGSWQAYEGDADARSQQGGSDAAGPWKGDDGGSGADASDGSSEATDGPVVSLRSGALFENYLADDQGRALYLFANDIPGAEASACTAACLERWPAFDQQEVRVGDGLEAGDFSRFQRADGAYQTAYKGRPLYYFAADAGAVSGDGMGGRWFVARDYFVLFGATADLTPQGASEPTPYMTNSAGRTLYVFMNDTKGSSAEPPTSACEGECLDAWPVWNGSASLEDVVVPSTLSAEEFGQFTRTVAGETVQQVTYRGWPLYFHTPDDRPGETSGHLKGAWRAFSASAFAAGGSGETTNRERTR